MTITTENLTLYRYYQTSEYADWKILKDDHPENPWRFARKMDADRVSILAVTRDLDINDGNEVGYYGPLFFDIDDADIGVALHSANKLVAKLLALGVPGDCLEIHLSGKKGVHIFLHPTLFADEEKKRVHPLLNEIYAKIALHLWVDGMDFQVFSGSKGRMVRPVNARRPDGRYKVQVTADALRSITVETYGELCARPQMILPLGKMKRVPKLAKLFDTAVKQATKIDPKKPASVDLSKLEGEVPDCVEKLAMGKRRKVQGDSSTSFNAIAMQVGCWSKDAGVDKTILSGLHERVAKNNPSSTGESMESRAKKLLAMHYYLASQSKYKFSCSGIKKLVSETPNCLACPIYNSVGNARVSESMFLFEQGGNYFSDKDCNVMVASFTMVRDSIVRDYESNKVVSSTIIVNVPLSGESHTIRKFQEDAWLSKNKFKEAINGIEGAIFLGSDNDVARLRSTMTRNDLLNGSEIKEVYSMRTMGLVYLHRNGPDNARSPDHRSRRVFAEPEFSINDVGVIGSHILSGRQMPAGATRIRYKDFYAPLNAENNRAFELLMSTNEAIVVSSVMGWFLATHLKSHIYALEHRFPLLNISGVAGTGKNSLIAVFMRLAGVEGERALLTLEAPQATRFPFKEALSNSATIPRVVNEMNPKSVGSVHYRRVVEMLKACFDGQEAAMGTLGARDEDGSGVATLRWKFTAPVVVLSEEPPQDDAFNQRSVSVRLTPQGLNKGKAAFNKLEPEADLLADFGRVLIREALGSTSQDIAAILDNVKVPENLDNLSIPERMKFGFRVVITGYRWAIPKLAKAGLSAENVRRLERLKLTFEEMLVSPLEHSKPSEGSLVVKQATTEVDQILTLVATMASRKSDEMFALERNRHYAIVGNELHLDTLTVYPILTAFQRYAGESANIRGETSFRELVRTMPYFITDREPSEDLIGIRRPIVKLDLDMMAEKDIPVGAFYE